MKNRKGFTLLEVLAVIVVLAVIAIITVPIVTNVMNDAKKNSFKTSMTNLVKAANNYYADNQLSMDSVITFCFGLTGSNCSSEKLKFSGKQPEKGKLVINPDGEISLLDMSNGTYYANYDSSIDDDIVITEDNQILNRDELTQAIKDLQKKLENNEKELISTKKALEAEIAKKSNKTDLDRVQTQLNSTTTIANTANNTANSLNSTRLNKTYPVGSIYISYSSTNPGTLFGGTWVAFGTGRTLVGINTGDGNFNTVGKTGGAMSFNNSHTHTINGHTHTTGSHVLTIAEMPSHNHRQVLVAANGNTYKRYSYNGEGSNGAAYADEYTNHTGGNQAHNHGNTGSTSLTTNASQGSQSLLQPYITVYMWRRTA